MHYFNSSGIRAENGQAAVWKHFTPVGGKPDLASCNSCRRFYTFNEGITSSLHNYLRTSHKEVVKEMEAEKEKLNTNKKYRFYDTNIFEYKRPYERISEYIRIKKMIRTNIRIYLYKENDTNMIRI